MLPVIHLKLLIDLPPLLWKRMMQVRIEVEPHIHWLIRDGSFHASLDRWLMRTQLPPSLQCTIKDLFTPSMVLKQEIALLLSNDAVVTIQRQCVRLQSYPDIPYWALTS